jgi:hypothetical protein
MARRARRIIKNSPTQSQVHVNRPLTQMSIAYMQDPANFVGRAIFPTIDVDKSSDSYFIWDRASMNRDDARQVGPGAEYPVIERKLSLDNYNCDVYKISEMLEYERLVDADAVLRLEESAVQNVTNKHMIRMERRFAERYFTTGLWTGSTTGTDIVPGTKWSVYATSNPIADIRAQVRALTLKGARRAGIKLLLTPTVFDVLIDHPVFLERYENVQVADIGEAELARILRIGQVIVGEAVYVSSNEGAPIVDEFILGGARALLAYSPPAAGINLPSAGYHFAWTGLAGPGGMMIDRLDRRERDAVQIRGKSAFDCKQTAADLGVFFDDVL